MRKYIWAFLITIPILLVVWNMVDSAEEPKITYNGTVEEEGYLTGILQGTDGIMPEEAEDRFVVESEIVEIEITETEEEMFSPESTPVPEPMPTTEAVLEEEQKK